MKKLACLATLSLAPFLFAQIPKLRPAEQAITDQKGVPIGIAVRVGEGNMTFTVPRLGPISAPGLPAIMPVHDDRERDQLIRTTAGAALAHLRYSKADYLESVSIGDGYQLEFTDPENGQVQETLRDANGRVLHAGAARAMVDRSSRVMGLCLDMVAADLGLASDWPKTPPCAIDRLNAGRRHRWHTGLAYRVDLAVAVFGMAARVPVDPKAHDGALCRLHGVGAHASVCRELEAAHGHAVHESHRAVAEIAAGSYVTGSGGLQRDVRNSRSDGGE